MAYWNLLIDHYFGKLRLKLKTQILCLPTGKYSCCIEQGARLFLNL